MSETQQVLLPEDSLETKTYNEFNKDRREFLERNADRFYKVYVTTGSLFAKKLYRKLLKERERVHV